MKIGIVVQRYGETIVGGAETYARTIAHLLARWHHVTVATTTASDHMTWCNDLSPGEEFDGPIRVLRFSVERERTLYWWELNRMLRGATEGQAASALPPAVKMDLRQRLARWPLGLQEEYIRWQGPYAPELFRWLRENSKRQDRFLFVTYLYPTTYFGMACVPSERLDFLPTLHDEPPAYLSAFARCFRLPQRVFFCTATEQRVARRLYGLAPGVGEVLGYGMTEPQDGSGTPWAGDPFLLFAGRIELGKAVPLLLDYFIRWKEEHPHSSLRLVLIGKSSMEIPTHPAIEYRGFVTDEEKGELMRHTVALVHPSSFESLGLIVLEAFLCSTPALVCGNNEVLVDHCRLSNGGLWYADYPEFAEALSWLLAHPQEAKHLGTKGREYARQHYGLEGFLARLAALYPPD